MIIEREILEDKLKDVISESARNRKIVQQVTQELNNKNMLDGDISGLFKFSTPISSVNDFVLYAFTKALFHATKNQNINPSDYFTKIEIEDGDKWKQEVIAKVKDKQPVIFSPVVRVNNNTWMTVKTVKELYDLFNVRTLVYNVKTQRPLKISERNGKIIERIDINHNSVSEMESLMSDDLYFPDPLTINALMNETLDMEENEKNMSVIFNSGELDLTDGWHRLRAYFKVLVKNPNLDMNVPILLTRHTEERAKEYIYQKSKHNPINKEFVKTINPSRLSNQIVDFLNTEKKSLLRGKITKDNAMLRGMGKKSVVLFNTLADVIDLTFNPKEQSELFKMNKFIMNGLNHIASIYDDLIKEVCDDKVWVTYICLLYLIKDMEDWESILDDVLLNIDTNHVILKAINRVGIKSVINYLKPLLPEIEEEEGD